MAIGGLQQHYQQQGERKQAQWLTREEYLRRRLQSAREQISN